MRVLDLYSGTGGWSEAFYRRGHDVTRIELDSRFSDVPGTTLADVLTWEPDGSYDVVLASPPCQAFSLASVRHHFLATNNCLSCGQWVMRLTGEKWSECCSDQRVKGRPVMRPKSAFGKHSLALLDRTLELVQRIAPSWWWMENPRATMQHFVPAAVPRATVWYCRYGDPAAKPTHLWGRWPQTWEPRPECANGAPCDACGGIGATDHAEDGTFGIVCATCGGSGKHHQPAPRGAKTGTQGKAGAAARAAVPYELSLDVCLAVERSADSLTISDRKPPL